MQRALLTLFTCAIVVFLAGTFLAGAEPRCEEGGNGLTYCFADVYMYPEALKKAAQTTSTTQAQAVVDQVNAGIPTDEDKKFILGLTALTVALGIGFIGVFCFIYRTKLDDHFARNFIILTVIFASLFLIVAGYTEQQTAPVFALLGTIVGYLFGIYQTKPPPEGKPPADVPPAGGGTEIAPSG